MSDGKIIQFPGMTSHDIDPCKVLDGAPRDLESCVVVAIEADGHFYLASSTGSHADVLMMLERAKLRLLDAVEGF